MSDGTGSRILKNATILVVVEVLSKVLGMAVVVIAARRLGVTSFGLLAFASAFTEIFGVVVAFGFDTLIIREVARDESRASRMMGDVFIMQAILAALSFLGMVVALHVFGTEGPKLRLTYIVGLSTTLNACLTTLNAFFRARQSVEYEAMVRFSFSALRAVLVSAILLLGYGVLTYAMAEFMTYVVCLLLCLYLLRRRVAHPTFRFEPHVWVRTFRGALPFALMASVIILYVRTDTVILSLLKGDEVTGLYSAATKFLSLFAFVPTSVIGAVLPAMSRQSVRSEASLVKTFAQTFRFLFMLGLPIALGISILSHPILQLLYGTQFTAAAPAMRIAMVTLLLGFLNFALDSAIISINRERTLLGIALVGLVFTVAVNIFLVSILSFVGASIAAALTEGLVLTIKLGVLHRKFGPLQLWRGLDKTVLSGLAMAAFLLTFQGIPFFFLIAPGAVIYLGALLLLRAFDAQEKDIIFASIPPAAWRLLQGCGVQVNERHRFPIRPASDPLRRTGPGPDDLEEPGRPE
jgi:O-antigen/teichoic acid export membrane protein